MKKILFHIVFLFNIINSLFAQDPEFSQYYANPLYLNPAYAGTDKGPRIVMNYRNEWPSINGSFVTYSASWDQNFDILSGGLGLQLMYDRAGEGELSTTIGNLMYSYCLPVSHNFAIRASLSAGLQQKSIDFSKLLFGDQIDPKLGFIYQTQEPLVQKGKEQLGPFPDFSAGFLGYSDKYYIGVAIDHINQPQVSFYDDPKSILPIKYTVHAGTLLPLDYSRNPESFVSPNILFQKQDNFTQFNIGVYYIKQYFVSGIWFRQTSENFDALIILIGIKKDPVKIGYSYDITFSDARIGAKGSHEVSLIIELKTYKKEKTKKWKEIICPIF